MESLPLAIAITCLFGSGVAVGLLIRRQLPTEIATRCDQFLDRWGPMATCEKFPDHEGEHCNLSHLIVWADGDELGTALQVHRTPTGYGHSPAPQQRRVVTDRPQA